MSAIPELFKRDLERRLEEYLRSRTSFKLIEDIRGKLLTKYPEVNEPPEEEPPMMAVAAVLLSAIILQTTELEKLVKFTGYSPAFIAAITSNMKHNKLWVAGRYMEASYSLWLSNDRIVFDDDRFWADIEVACGMAWTSEAQSFVSLDPCRTFWDERGGYHDG